MIDFNNELLVDEVLDAIECSHGHRRGLKKLRKIITGQVWSTHQFRTFLRYDAWLNQVDVDWLADWVTTELETE